MIFHEWSIARQFTPDVSLKVKTCCFMYRFEVNVKFSIPNIIVEPTLDVIQKSISDVTNAILEANNGRLFIIIYFHKFNIKHLKYFQPLLPPRKTPQIFRYLLLFNDVSSVCLFFCLSYFCFVLHHSTQNFPILPQHSSCDCQKVFSDFLKNAFFVGDFSK